MCSAWQLEIPRLNYQRSRFTKFRLEMSHNWRTDSHTVLKCDGNVVPTKYHRPWTCITEKSKVDVMRSTCPSSFVCTPSEEILTSISKLFDPSKLFGCSTQVSCLAKHPFLAQNRMRDSLIHIRTRTTHLAVPEINIPIILTRIIRPDPGYEPRLMPNRARTVHRR